MELLDTGADIMGASNLNAPGHSTLNDVEVSHILSYLWDCNNLGHVQVWKRCQPYKQSIPLPSSRTAISFTFLVFTHGRQCLFLNRRLFPQIQEGLRRGGLLIFESLLKAPRSDDRGEHCRDFYLRENELLRSFLSLRILHYHEELHSSDSDQDRRLASLVAVRNQ